MLAQLESTLAMINPSDTDGEPDQIAAVNLWG